jgi:hypothetical protein
MKRIGQGYYYNVYDLGNGRVRKIPRSQIAQIWQLFVWYFLSPKTLFQELMRAPFSYSKRKEEFSISKEIISHAPSFFGNPKIEGDIYEQDKVTILGDVMQTSSPSEFLARCKEYTTVIHSLWKQGIGETVFNFTINAGIDDAGKLILLDTNEFTFDKERMKSEVVSKRFLRASSFKRLPENLKRPVQDIFEKEFSLEKFEEYWAKDVS